MVFALPGSSEADMKNDVIPLKEKIGKLERAAILEALRETGWVKARAARRLGITERMIGYKIKKYGIRKEVEDDARQALGN